MIRTITVETFVDQIVALETREGVSGFKLTDVQGPRRCPGAALGRLRADQNGRADIGDRVELLGEG
jgi:hypothetical protein